MEEVYAELQKLGFSKYECKAYVGLLQHHPVTGYEISKRTGVPRSMIYEVLGKLLDKGAIYLVPSDPVKYVPIPANELIQRLRKQIEQSFSFLERKLNALESERGVDVIWHIRNDEMIIKEMIEMVEKAKNELWLSIWEPQIPMIKEAVEKRIHEGIPVFSILFGAPEIQLGFTFHHNYMPPDVVKERIGGNLTIVTCDGQEVLIANFLENATSWAVKTHDPALVLVATEYIRHDIMIGAITREFGSDKLDSLWRNDPDLVHIVTGRRFSP
ncbi:TrmB family transcriptional regulator [Thermoflavimicrobium daqui]|uniref:TrmB family transcriptional regulator n=1 Tax=Thermoflavimicrobium daqui TaxID=2137476 RepID=A0A364K442_9BACL|nr:helix-turn-helix domain-containing protein [Thermoflavimicrobium daqui]RAL24029.1 TrmB family transcriptional regulator [Thermoflavimicrobium daqui]